MPCRHCVCLSVKKTEQSAQANGHNRKADFMENAQGKRMERQCRSGSPSQVAAQVLVGEAVGDAESNGDHQANRTIDSSYRQLTESVMGALWACSGFSKTEICFWHAEFYRKYPSGRITLDQFNDIYRMISGVSANCVTVKYLFKLFDQDDNDYITFDEFLRVIAISAREDFDEKIDTAFELCDHNGHGLIKKDELHPCIRVCLPALSEDGVSVLLSEVFASMVRSPRQDTVSREEFMVACTHTDSIRNIMMPLLSMGSQWNRVIQHHRR